MECLKCINICPTNAVEMDNEVSCVRFEEKSALKMNKEKCHECNKCMVVCPIGNLSLNAKDCTCCIVCKGKPGCAVSSCNRASLLNSMNSIVDIAISKIYFSIK